ncbi:MAG: FHA domain-containing protein [Deltaproteobacteria bacterium]|nr:FHA domain-containing protein [Deltaproteobacteria bacterium]
MSNHNLRKPFLEGLSPSEKGIQIELSLETLHFGRSQDNEVVLEDQRVSRHHAHLTYEEGAYYLMDLNTPNGTLVNQQKILNQKLNNGDVIQIGKHVFRFCDLASTAQPVTEFHETTGLQTEPISASSPPQSHSSMKHLFWYGGGGIFVLALLWILLQPLPQRKPAGDKKNEFEPSSDLNLEGALPDISRESYAINYEKANQLYLSGYREWLSKNYLRALDDFKAALELYPEHRLAKIHLDKVEQEITESVNQHYKSGINYFNSAQYALAVHHFQQVMALLARRAPATGYCDIRAEQSMLENPDFEKYCDSLKKIEEAKSKERGQAP